MAGVVPVIRVLQESLAGATIDRVHGIVNGTTNFILTEMATNRHRRSSEALAEAQRLGYAEADPTEDVDGRDAAAKMAILARLAFDTPVHLDQVRYEGIEHIQPDDLEYARRARPRAEADRHRRADRRRALGPRASRRSCTRGHPLASVNGPFNAVTVESSAITEITMSGPGRRRAADRQRGARRRDQRDDPARLDARDLASGSRSSQDVVSAFYLHLEVADEPGVLAHGRAGAGGTRGVGQVRRPEGAPRPGAAGDGRAPGARVAASSRAMAEIAELLEVMRAPPRAIRVLEEEFGRSAR